MDGGCLRIYAELLEAEIASHLDESGDVRFLSTHPSLIQAIDDAKKGLFFIRGRVACGGGICNQI